MSWADRRAGVLKQLASIEGPKAFVRCYTSNAELLHTPSHVPLPPFLVDFYKGLLDSKLIRLASDLAEEEPRLVNLPNKRGHTLLVLVASESFVFKCDLRRILRIGGDPTVVVPHGDPYETTPDGIPLSGTDLILHVAKSGAPGLIPCLHRAGAKLDKVLEVLADQMVIHNCDVIRSWPHVWTPGEVDFAYVLHHCTDLNVRNEDGETPFHIVARARPSIDLIDIFVAQGADIFNRDCHGESIFTAYALAIYEEHIRDVSPLFHLLRLGVEADMGYMYSLTMQFRDPLPYLTAWIFGHEHPPSLPGRIHVRDVLGNISPHGETARMTYALAIDNLPPALLAYKFRHSAFGRITLLNDAKGLYMSMGGITKGTNEELAGKCNKCFSPARAQYWHDGYLEAVRAVLLCFQRLHCDKKTTLPLELQFAIFESLDRTAFAPLPVQFRCIRKPRTTEKLTLGDIFASGNVTKATIAKLIVMTRDGREAEAARRMLFGIDDVPVFTGIQSQASQIATTIVYIVICNNLLSQSKTNVVTAVDDMVALFGNLLDDIYVKSTSGAYGDYITILDAISLVQGHPSSYLRQKTFHTDTPYDKDLLLLMADTYAGMDMNNNSYEDYDGKEYLGHLRHACSTFI